MILSVAVLAARGAAPYWPVTTTCTLNQCCCHKDEGWKYTATYQRDTCHGQDNTVIGCFACTGPQACVMVSTMLMSVIPAVMGYMHVNGLVMLIKKDLLLELAVAMQNISARNVRAGSVVPDGTCNDVNNVDEVGTLTTGDKRCRACFVSTFFHFVIYLSTISFLAKG